MNSGSLSRKALLEVAASFGAFAALGVSAEAATATAAPAAAAVVGAWKLEIFDVVAPDGSRTPRFGPSPLGYLIYTPSGRVSAILAGSHRTPFEQKTVTVTSESKGQMLEDFLAYAGTFDVKGDRVFHHVDVSVFTDLIGTTLERQFNIEGDTLTIRTITAGMWGNDSILVWKRA
jgi:hypothetical protein